MTIMMGKLYAALRAANSPEEQAREAAEEAAAVHDRFDTLDHGLEAGRHDLDRGIEAVPSFTSFGRCLDN
jgi:hypothetical protein